jgi:hypothetical protein
MSAELGFMGHKGLELTLRTEVVLLLPLLQLQLPICHRLLRLSYGGRLRVDVLLLLDGGIGTGLSYSVQLLSLTEHLLGSGIELLNGGLLFVDQILLHA